MNLLARILLDNSGFVRPAQEARAQVATLRATISGLVAPIATAVAGIAGFAAGARLLRNAVHEAARMEDLETSFGTLLGSVAAAKTRMEELARFAAATPFELPEIAQASKLLQAFTGDALATGKGLRLVGDAAAAVGQPLEAVSMWFGRLYSALQQGGQLGEPIQNLTQLGLISSEARNQLMALQGTALDGARTMQVLETAFGANAGAMDRLSRTFNGKLSTMRDAWNAALRAFGEPLRDALKPFITELTAWLDSLAPKARAAGQAMSEALRGALAASETGQLGEFLRLSLGLGFKAALNVFLSGLREGLVSFGTLAGTALSNLGAIKDVLVGAAAQFGAALLRAAETPLAYIQAWFENLADFDNDKIQRQAQGQAESEVAQRFGVKSKSDLYTKFGWFSRTNEEDARLAQFEAEAAKRQSELEKTLGYVTVADRAKRILQSGGPKFGFGSVAMSADEIRQAGSERFAEGVAALLAPIGDASRSIAGQIKGFTVEDFAGAGDALAQLRKFMAKLPKREQIPQAEVTKRPSPELDLGQMNNKEKIGSHGGIGTSNVDRLARVGVFIGAGGPANDYARRTATATEKLHDLMREMLRKFPTTPFPQLNATWGS